MMLFLFQNCSPLGESSFEQSNTIQKSNDAAPIINPPIETPTIPTVPTTNPITLLPNVNSISIVNIMDSTDILTITENEIIDTQNLNGKSYKVHATINNISKLVSFNINGVQNDEVNPPYTSSEFQIKSGTQYNVKVVSFEDINKSGLQSEPYLLTFSTKKGSPEIDTEYSKKYLFFGGYEANEGSLSSATFDKYWGIRWKRTPASGQIVNNSIDSFEGQSLKIRYPGKTLGSNLRVNYSTDFKKLGIGLKEAAYLRYYVKFHKGWDWAISGKIPGLAGGDQVSGGDPVNGTNGWSMRFVWYDGDNYQNNADAAIYAYVAGYAGQKKTGKYGKIFKLVDPVTKKYMHYPVDQWVCIEQYIKLNAVGKYDGVVQAWMDEKLGVNLKDIMYRTKVNDSTKVGQMLFSTFFGGATDKWAPAKDVHASFDNFAISESRIGCKK